MLIAYPASRADVTTFCNVNRERVDSQMNDFFCEMCSSMEQMN